MGKVVASVMALMLIVSMSFGAIPLAFASELAPDAVAPAAASFDQSTQPQTEGYNALSVPQDDPQDNSNSVTSEDGTSELVQGSKASSVEDSVLSDTVSVDTLPTTTIESEPESALGYSPNSEVNTDEKIKALIELGDALDDLYRTIISASGPTIVRADTGVFSTNHFSATFQEGIYYNKVLTLVNRINELLEVCGLPNGLYVSSLPMQVLRELPEGFDFTHNTLTLTNQSLLQWNEEFDEPGALTRSYEIELQLNTGNTYIDEWLKSKGRNGLGTATFTIELQLIQLFSPFEPKPEPEPKPDSGIVSPAESDNTEPPMTVALVALSTAVVPITNNEQVSDAAVEEHVSPVTNSSIVSVQTIEIGGSTVPMASMMIDESGNIIFVNVGLVSISLVASVASLASLRQRKPSISSSAQAAAQSNGVGTTLGIVGISLGAMSIFLFVFSQYMLANNMNTSIAWTPVLGAITVVQVVCCAGLFVSKYMAPKRTSPRVRIRY